MSNNIEALVATTKADIVKRKAMPEFGDSVDGNIQRLNTINETKASFSLENVEALIAALEQAQSEAKEFRHRLRNEQAITEDADKRIAELQEQKVKWANWAIALGAKSDELEARPLCVKLPDELDGKSFEYIANKFQVPMSAAQWVLVGWNACRSAVGTVEGD